MMMLLQSLPPRLSPTEAAFMSHRQQSSDPFCRPDDERPVLPPIRDWFRDELSRSPLPPTLSNSPSTSRTYYAPDGSQISSKQLRGMPASSSSLPPSPIPNPADFYFHKKHSGTHRNPYPSSQRSFTPPINSRAVAGEHSAPYHSHLDRPNYSEHGASHLPKGGPYSSAPEAGSSAQHTERHDHTRSGRASSPSLSKYECGYCGKGFNRPSSLKRHKTHLNTHTGAKPFICPHDGCGRAFSVQSNMRRHARVHTQINARTNSESSGEDSELSPFDPNQDTPTTPPSISRSAESNTRFTHSPYEHHSPMQTN